MEQSSRNKVRTSNNRAELIDSVATEVALSQAATAAMDAAAAELLGVNATDLRALGQLFAAGSMAAGGVARATGLSKGAMTTALDRLEKAGYARRVRSVADRRSVRVELTPDATRLIETIWGPVGSAGKEQLEAYTVKELELLLDFLRRGRELQEREAERLRSMRRPAAYPEGEER